jgi:hypothetical protein
MTHRNVLPIASVPSGGYNRRPIKLPHLETFPGAACHQPIELPRYKAAPLQAVFGPFDTQRVCRTKLKSFQRFALPTASSRGCEKATRHGPTGSASQARQRSTTRYHLSPGFYRRLPFRLLNHLQPYAN